MMWQVDQLLEEVEMLDMYTDTHLILHLMLLEQQMVHLEMSNNVKRDVNLHLLIQTQCTSK